MNNSMRFLAIMVCLVIGCADSDGSGDSELPQPMSDEGVPMDTLSSADAEGSGEVGVDPMPALSGPEARPLPEVGPSGAAGRFVMMDVPLDLEEARQAGCLLAGRNVGTGTANLVTLGGGLDIQVQPNATGDISLILLLRALDWPAGTTAQEASSVSFELGQGVRDAESFAFKPGERATFLATPIMDGWFETSRGEIVLPLALVDSPPLPLQLSSGHIAGRLGADELGLTIQHGTLVGYIRQESIRFLLERVRAVCESEMAPGLCGLVSAALSQPDDELYSLIVGIMGGPDTALADGTPRPCDPTNEMDCDAVSVCVIFEAAGVSLVESSAESQP